MKVITIANNKGGVGKTMQCYQLACYLADKGYRILVIDFDSQANLSATLGVDVQRSLIPEWLIGDVELDDVMLPVNIEFEFGDNMKIVPASRHLASLSKLLILSENDVRKFAGRKERLLRLRLQGAEEQFDYVLIDTPPMLGDELIMSLVASNMILIPTQAQDYSIDGLEELMDTFEIIRDTENPGLDFTIVPSMVNPRRKIERQRLEELAQSFNITPPVRNLVDMQESVSTRTPIFKMKKSKRGVNDFKAVWDFLNI